jgi:hypothetical protein
MERAPSPHFLLDGVCMYVSVLNPSSALSYTQVHRYLIGSLRLVASLGSIVKRHGDRRGGRGVGWPPIRRVRSQILLYLIKPVPWFEVYLVTPYVFVAQESTLQVKKNQASELSHGNTSPHLEKKTQYLNPPSFWNRMCYSNISQHSLL